MKGTPVTDSKWMDDAECREHPVLPADAWFEIDTVPKGDGARAAVVCRFACPVRAECDAHWRGYSAIAGSGWFDGHGHRRTNPTNMLDIYQTAAYLGVSENWVKYQTGKRLFVAAKINLRNWYTIDNVQDVGQFVGPEHGTYAAANLHILRGQPPCAACRNVMAISA